MDTLYTLIVFLHIVSAIAAIGAWFALLIMISQLRQRPQTAPTLLPVMARVAAFPRHGGLSLLVTGILLVGMKDWALFQLPWIAISLVLLLGMIGGGLVVIGPRLKAFGGMVATGTSPQQLDAALVTLRQLGLLMLSAGLVIVFLMVFRPGA